MTTFTHAQTRRVKTNGDTLSRVLSASSNQHIESSHSVTTGTTKAVYVTIDPTSLKSLYMDSSKAVTVRMNSPSGSSFTLTPGAPREWMTGKDSDDALWITERVTSLMITNASGSTATVEIRVLHDGEVIGSSSLANLRFNLDAQDLTEITYAYGAEFIGDSRYLVTAAAYNFNTNHKFSISGWFNGNVNHDNAIASSYGGEQGLDRTLFAQWNQGTSAAFAICTGGSVKQGRSLRSIWATNSGGSTSVSLVTPDSDTNPYNPSHWCVTFDSGRTPVVKHYLDGVLQTVTGSQPTAVNNSSALLTVGRLQNSALPCKGTIGPTVIFDNFLLDASDTTDIVALYNNGTPLLNSELSGVISAGAVSAKIRSWDMTESSGARADSSGNSATLSESGGTINRANRVMKYRERSPAGMLMRAVKNSAARANFGIPAFGTSPSIMSSGINSHPAFRFRWNHALYAPIWDALNTVTADFFDVIYLDTDPLSEIFIQESADELTTNFYFMTGLTPDSGSLKPTLRIKNTGSGPGDNHVYASTDIAATTAYIINWRCLGTGGAASFECRVNGATISTLSYGSSAAHNTGPASVTKRDNYCIAGLCRTDGPSIGPFDARVGQSMAFSPGLSQTENRAVEAYLADRWGITLP